MLNGKAILASGRVDLDGDNLSLDNLWIRHGDTSVRLNGQPYEKTGLQFDIVIDELNHYLDDGSGSLSASGMLSLNTDSPVLRINASSDSVGFAGLHVSDLSINDLNTDNKMIDAEVISGAVTYAGYTVDTVRLHGRADKQSQALALKGLLLFSCAFRKA